MPDYQTLRGVVSNLKYIEQIGRTRRYTDKPGSASIITFEVGGRAVSVINSKFPPLCEGDDVQVVGVVYPRGGLEVAQLQNHTTGTKWQISVWGTAWRNVLK